MSSHHHHLASDRSRAGGRKGKGNGERAELDRLLHPSYANPSSLARGSTHLGSTYVDAQGLEHESSYNPYGGLAALNGQGRKFKGRAYDRDRESSVGSDDGHLDTLPPMLPSSSMAARSISGHSSGTNHHHHSKKWNRPAAEMSLTSNMIIAGVDYSPQHGRRREPSDSVTSSSSHYPPTTARTSKSRRSTLLSQTTTYTDYPTSEDLEPPPASRYSASAYKHAHPGPHGPSYPSPPSSVVSSVTPQIYPETPAQAHKRRSMEHSSSRPIVTSRTAPLAPPSVASEKATITSVGSGGYVPTRWQEEKKGRRGAVEQAYRPPEQDNEWTPGCMDNIKRSWGEITLATRFGVFRAKKKLERKTLGH